MGGFGGVRLCNWRNEKWGTAITSLSSIGKSSAATFSWLSEVQILNRCFTAEMILTDKAIVVTSNCLLRISFSELPSVSHWEKIVLTVIPYFVSQNLLPAVNFAPTALAASLTIFISHSLLSAVSPAQWALLLVCLFNLSFYPPSSMQSSIIHPHHCLSSSETLFWSPLLYSIPVKTRGRSKHKFVSCLWIQAQ